MSREHMTALVFDLNSVQDRQQYLQVAMARAGVSISDIAASTGVGRTMVSQTLSGQRTSAKVRAAIAESIGEEVDRIWPPSTPEEV